MTSVWRRKLQRFLDIIVVSAVFMFLFLMTVAARPAASAKAPDFSQDSVDPYRDFVAARAAAETCLGRELTDEEHNKFLVSLSYRDPLRRSLEQLAAEIEEDLNQYRQDFEMANCDRDDIFRALFDWEIRVTLFAGISPRDSNANSEQSTRSLGEGKSNFEVNNKPLGDKSGESAT